MQFTKQGGTAILIQEPSQSNPAKTPITDLSEEESWQVLTSLQEPMLAGFFIHTYLTEILTTTVFIHEGGGTWQVKSFV